MAIAPKRIEKILEAITNISAASHPTRKQSQNKIHAIEKMLTFGLRVIRINRFNRHRFVTKVLSVNLAHDLRADLITRGSQVESLNRRSREDFKSGLGIGNDLSVHDVC